MKELSKDIMEQLLADYCFERLSESESKLFESNLHKYPELEKECEELNAFFLQLNSADLNKHWQDESKNLTVKVNKKLDNKSRSRKLDFAYFVKAMIPAVAVAGIFLLFIMTKKDVTSDLPQVAIENRKIQLISNSEITAIIDGNIELEDALNQQSYPIEINESISEKDYIDLFFDGAFVDLDEMKYYFYSQTDGLSPLLSDVSLLDEKDFQEILKELDDEFFAN